MYLLLHNGIIWLVFTFYFPIGGLYIKILLFRKPLLFLVFMMFIFAGCDLDALPVQKAKILIGGGPGSEFCLFIIYSDGTIKITSCNIKSINMRKDDFINEVLDEKVIKMSSQNKKQVFDLLDTLLMNESSESHISQYEDTIEVRALIEEKLYWSIYTTNIDRTSVNSEYNRDLLSLTYNLLKLSPIQVGGEDNPIQLP